MGVSFIRSGDVAAIGIAAFLMVSCTQKTTLAASGNRNFAACEIFQVVMSDSELVRYAGGYFDDVKDIPLVWDGAPKEQEDCRDHNAKFMLTKSSGLEVKPGDKYIVANKMYFDDDAAFVELLLLPSGKHGDFFLRKNGKWRVVQRSIWETK